MRSMVENVLVCFPWVLLRGAINELESSRQCAWNQSRV